jgi:hypothetical protein
MWTQLIRADKQVWLYIYLLSENVLKLFVGNQWKSDNKTKGATFQVSR